MSITELLPWRLFKSETGSDEVPIGIDLGYKQACVAVYKNRQMTVIHADNGKLKTPTYISYAYDQKRQQFTNLVGSKAIEARKNGQTCVYDIKRIIGRSYHQKEVQRLVRTGYFPFHIADQGMPMVNMQYSHWMKDREYFYSEELTAKLLVHLKQLAENHLNHAVTQVVITVPATFNSFQRLAVQNAGKLAGFKDVVSITEATAAVIAYYNDFPSLTEDILVFDLGLSSFDLTLLNVDKGKIRVRAVGSDPNLGGWVVTENLRTYIKKRYKAKYNSEYGTYNMAALYKECEEKKKMLSTEGCESVKVAYKGYVHGNSTISRALFAELNQDFFRMCFSNLEKFLADARFEATRVQRVILVGGSTRMQEIHQQIAKRFAHAKITHNINEETVVAAGAAIHASAPVFREYGYEGDFIGISTIPIFGVITSENLGVRLHSSQRQRRDEAAALGVIIPKGTQTPCHLKKRFICLVSNCEVVVDVHAGNSVNVAENKILCSLAANNIDLPEDGDCHFDIHMYLSAHGHLQIKVVVIGWFSDAALTEKVVIMPKDFNINYLNDLKAYGDQFSENASHIWSMEREIPNEDVYTAGQIEVAKASYQNHMDAVVSNFEVVSEQTLKLVHDKAVKMALKALLKAHPLTKEGYEEAKRPLDGLYAKYLKLNTKKKTNPCKYTVGLDLGTTFCSAAFVENGRAQAIPIDVTRSGDGTKFRSVVSITSLDSIDCGNAAQGLAFVESENFIFDLKRMIGQHIKDPQVQKLKRYWPFEISNNNCNIEILSRGRAFRPEELLTKLIASIAEMVTEHLNEEMVNVVVAIPAYFKPLQVRLTKQACLDAGLNVIKFVQEPIAAALAYSHDNNEIGKDITAMVVDLGGGTFDIAVVHIKTNGIEILHTDGDPFLGGQDIDNIIAEYFIQEFEKRYQKNIREEERFPMSIRRIKDKCEDVKINLSRVRNTVIRFDHFHGQDDIQFPISRDKLADLMGNFVEKYMAVIERVVTAVSHEIDQVVLVGGSSKVPIIRRKLEEMFGNKVIKDKSINADLAVASGAAILASRLQNQIRDELITDSMQKLVLAK